MQAELDNLKNRLAEVDDVENAAALLEWDQLVMMPPGGAEGRADQTATLQKIAHEKLVAPEVGRLLDSLSRELRDRPAEDDDASLVRVAARRYERKRKIPAELVAEMYQATALGLQIWAEARAKNDFPHFLPALERIVDIKQRVAACFPETESPYDALLDDYEPGMLTHQVAAMFEELKGTLLPLVKAITARPPVDDSALRRDYPEARQLEFSLNIVRQFGYDFNRGRQDLAVHPFCTSFSTGDVRITTRVLRNYLPTCLMGSMHECGHALYDQGYPDRFRRSPLAYGASLGIHESQSRLWENLVGRSRGFWEFFYPLLQAAFPENLDAVDVDVFYRAINRVHPSYIRVEADEVTYNLHTLLRYEMEVALIEGRLAPKDAPEAWNAKYKTYFGQDVPEDRLGVLQDTHWGGGLIGYFPTYTIGNLVAAQFFAKAMADEPGLRDDFKQGEFGRLLGWLRQNVHAHGRKYLPADLVERVTGQPLSAKPYLAYLKQKFGELYRL